MTWTEPDKNGFASLGRLTEGYVVLVAQNPKATKKHFWIQTDEWQPFYNSWGCPYSIKGCAINKAERMMRGNWGMNLDAVVCVVEQKSRELVWTSWD